MTNSQSESNPPRRKPLRRFLQWLSRTGFGLLSKFEIIGEENFPESGPLIVVTNHFHFLDAAAVIRVAPWPLDFFGGAQMPHAPKFASIFARLWGILPVFRGTGSRSALKAGESIINAGGILGVFPEGGMGALFLRSPRPGAGYLAAQTGAKLLPIGLDGLAEGLPILFRGRRPKITIRVGKPFGPFTVTGSGRERREQLDQIGHEIMRHIAELIPPDKHGHYSQDPAVREAALEAETFSWADHTEGEGK